MRDSGPASAQSTNIYRRTLSCYDCDMCKRLCPYRGFLSETYVRDCVRTEDMCQRDRYAYAPIEKNKEMWGSVFVKSIAFIKETEPRNIFKILFVLDEIQGNFQVRRQAYGQEEPYSNVGEMSPLPGTDNGQNGKRKKKSKNIIFARLLLQIRPENFT